MLACANWPRFWALELATLPITFPPKAYTKSSAELIIERKLDHAGLPSDVAPGI
jgi:hypothetical protein